MTKRIQNSNIKTKSFVIIFGFCALLFAVNLLLPDDVSADTVYTTLGETIKGLVVEEHHDRITLSTYKGELQILKLCIEEIFFDNEEQNYIYLADREFDAGNLEPALRFYQKAYQINSRIDRLKGAFCRLADAAERKKLAFRLKDLPAELDRQLGITIVKSGKRIKIKSVRKFSPAQKADIRPGDFIIDVWGSSIMFMDAASAAEILIGAPRSIVKLNIEKEITVPVRPIPWFGKIFLFTQMKYLGFDFSLRPAGLVIKSVVARSPAQKSGLKAGDVVTSINGESTRYMPLSSARKKVLKDGLKQITLTVRRQAILRRSGK